MDSTRRSRGWAWAIVFVAAVYALSAAGSWTRGDHAEMILMSHRLIEQGTVTLAPEGQSPPELRWKVSGHSRLFPGTAIALAPLVVIDRVAGWGAPPELGRIVHLGGHLYVLAALAILACAVRCLGGTSAAAAAVVLILGTSWPLWQVARHGGAEPIIIFLIAIFHLGAAKGSLASRLLVCVALPWVHPTGSLLALTLAVLQPVHKCAGRSFVRRMLGLDAAACVGATSAAIGSVLLIWNFAYHGHWFAGGYSGAPMREWLTQPLLQELFGWYLIQIPQLVPILFVLSLGALALGRQTASLLISPVALLLAISVFFSVYTPSLGQDHVRRLSVVWLGFGFVVGLIWDRLRVSKAAVAGIVVLNVLIGAYWFQVREFDYYAGHDGSRYPFVIWTTWLFTGRSPLVYGSYVAIATLVLAIAGWRLWRDCIAGPEPPMASSRSHSPGNA